MKLIYESVGGNKMFCTKCGNQLPDESKFCPCCGEKIVRESSEEQAVNQTEYYGGYNRRIFIPLPTDRSLLVYILLSIVTCGIYNYYYIHRLSEDMNVACDGDGDTTPGVVSFILLSIVTCGIYSLIWYYKLGNRLQINARRYGMEFSENGTSILLWTFLGAWLCGVGYFIAMYIIIKNTNLICQAYNDYNNSL